MGDRLAGRAARQHSDLTARPAPTKPFPAASPSSDRLRVVVLTLLAIDGVLSAVAATFLLPLRIGSVPLPVSALVSGILNVALVWAALQWTSSPRLAALPLWGWLLTIAAMTLGGPGDDIVLGGVGIMEYAAVLLIVVGALPPAVVLWRHLYRG